MVKDRNNFDKIKQIQLVCEMNILFSDVQSNDEDVGLRTQGTFPD